MAKEKQMLTPETAKQIALQLIKELETNKIPIKESYLFGSIIAHKNNEYSDIDIALISDVFTGFGFEDRKKINPFILKINSSIEPHPFPSSKFITENPFVNEIIKNGMKIK